MRTKCYISGPITGVKDHMKHFEYYENRLKQKKRMGCYQSCKSCYGASPGRHFIRRIHGFIYRSYEAV